MSMDPQIDQTSEDRVTGVEVIDHVLVLRRNDNSTERFSLIDAILDVVPADGDLVAGDLAIWFDSTNGAAKVMFKGKSADGTVATGNVALT